MTHQPGPEATWMESMAFYFADLDHDVAGVIGCSAWPNTQVGLTWVGLVAKRPWVVVQRSTGGLPLETGFDEGGGLHVGSNWWLPHEGGGRLRVDDPDATFDVTIRDYFPMSPWAGTGEGLGAEALADKASGGHTEASGSFAGTLRIGDRSLDVAGHLHRDNSWGVRNHEGVRSYRWSIGTVGPELSWSALVLQIHDLPPFTTGWVVRNGTIVGATGIESLVTTDHDSLTTRGWHTTISCEDGSVLEVQSGRLVGNLIDTRPPMVGLEGLGEVHVEGRTGFGALNSIVNPQLGESLPPHFVGGTTANGLVVLEAG